MGSPLSQCVNSSMPSNALAWIKAEKHGQIWPNLHKKWLVHVRIRASFWAEGRWATGKRWEVPCRRDRQQSVCAVVQMSQNLLHQYYVQVRLHSHDKYTSMQQLQPTSHIESNNWEPFLLCKCPWRLKLKTYFAAGKGTLSLGEGRRLSYRHSRMPWKMRADKRLKWGTGSSSWSLMLVQC